MDERGAQRPYVIHIGDREADIYELFEEVAGREQTGLVVRAAWDRRVESEYKYLWAALEAQPLGGTLEIEAPPKNGRPKRPVTLEVRWASVPLRAPTHYGKRPCLTVQAVWVVEKNPPEGMEALEWMLLTTEPVEEFHLALKSGCRMEKMQMESRDALERMLRMWSVTALRIVALRYWAEVEPDAPAEQVLSAPEQEALRGYVEKHFRTPVPPRLTVAWVRYWIGRIGGHRGLKSNGQPGIRTLWRGWCDFQLIFQAYRAFV